MSEAWRLLRLMRRAAEGLLFLVRMWASERRFRRHARRRATHEAAAARCGERMAVEVAYRVALCHRRVDDKRRQGLSRTASGVPAVLPPV